MPSDDSSTMYGNPLAEFLMFLLDFVVFTARAVYFLLETLILTILPNRYRKLKVSFFSLFRQTSHRIDILCVVLVFYHGFLCNENVRICV